VIQTRHLTQSVTRRLVVASAAAAILGGRPRAAPAFPDRTVRILAPFAAGGTVDTVARILADALATILGRQVIVENKPGGSGSIAATATVVADADGHTLLFGIFALAVAPALARLDYDTLADLAAVSQVASVPLFMFASPRTRFDTVAGAVAAARAAPRALSYATGGTGSSGHMAAELFARRAGVTLTHVPYRGSAAAIASVIAGDEDLLWDTPNPATADFVASGRLKALAVMTPARLPAWRDIPAISEAGLGGDLEVQAWQGILVRSGTPAPVIAALYTAIAAAMGRPDTRARIAALSVEPMATPPAAFAAFFASEVRRWTEAAGRAGLGAQ